MHHKKREICSARANLSSRFYLCKLLILNVPLLLISCANRSGHWKPDTSWETLIQQEKTQPNSIIQVDNGVVAYMKKNNVPGLAIAITKDDKLIYAKAYGYANVTTQERVTNNSLFRLASLSKGVTSVAIMKLIQDGRLSMNSKLFGDDGIFGNDYIVDDTTLKNITIDHLLHHTCGGWSSDVEDSLNNDPMFKHYNFSASKLISWTLRYQSLKKPPGAIYAYSNFGYFLLGRVVEKVTGKAYEEYVKSEILAPLGINDMQITGNTEVAKKPDEVVYYQDGDEPYRYNLSRMDAAGGWIASPIDLLRLIVSVDGLNIKKAILDSPAIKTMLSPSTANPNYACGWNLTFSDRGLNWFHFGELMGTEALIAHTHIGFSWAILTNTGLQTEETHSDLDQLVWKAINDSTTRWPDRDLF